VRDAGGAVAVFFAGLFGTKNTFLQRLLTTLAGMLIGHTFCLMSLFGCLSRSVVESFHAGTSPDAGRGHDISGSAHAAAHERHDPGGAARRDA